MVRRVFLGGRMVTVQGLRPVATVSEEFLARVWEDPEVQDWLFGVTEREETRSDYLTSFGRFLKWTGWTPTQILQLKKEAMKQGEPFSEVERAVKRFHETLRQMGYAGKSRARDVAAISSFIASKGYTLPRKLVRIDVTDKLEIRVPTPEEVELFIQYAGSLEKKLLYTMMRDSSCRPRVFPTLQWAWLEQEWWKKQFVYVNLPKQFRPGPAGGPRKFEPPMFLGPQSVTHLKQIREARIKKGHIPLDQDHILRFTQSNINTLVNRDYKKLMGLKLIRPSRLDEKREPAEQAITPKSWRKYQFNVIDAIPDISTEWRKMLKGRDLQTEKYYSVENIKNLKDLYSTRIYPHLSPGTTEPPNQEELKNLRNLIEELKLKTHQDEEQLEELRLSVRMLEDASRLKISLHNEVG